MVKNKSENEKSSLIEDPKTNRNNGTTLDGKGKIESKTSDVSITWKNLKITAVIKQRHVLRNSTRIFKEIIHDVNGYVEPSKLVAILGASGSGKSTMISALANRQPNDLKIDGDVRINGEKIQSKLMRKISGFVYQDDLFIPTVTVSEHLNLAAQMKLDKKITSKDRKTFVDKLLTEVGLIENANRLIGDCSYGEVKMNLSGGELKRLSVATELLTNPSLLFCDEPTTGLDSFTALNLMMIMKEMTNQTGKIIICTIHQPSEKIFELFDQIILLHKGKICFNGTSKDALTFFQSVGYFYNGEQNPADYLVTSLAVSSGQESETDGGESALCLQFEQSQYAKNILDRIERENYKTAQNFYAPERIEHISWLHMLYLLTYREIKCSTRDPSVQKIRFIYKTAVAIFTSFFMMGSITLTQEGVQALKGVAFSMVAENFFPPMENFIVYFPNKMAIFQREYSNNLNTPSIFYLSNIISLIPGFLIDPIVTTILMYLLVGLQNNWFAFIGTIFVNILVFNTAATFGMLISLATDNFNVLQSIIMIVEVVAIPLSGIYMNVRSIPWIFAGIRDISWMTYGIESLLILQLDGVNEIQCSESVDLPCLKNGEEVLESLGFNNDNLLSCVTIICIVYLVLHVLSFFTLKIRLFFRTNR